MFILTSTVIREMRVVGDFNSRYTFVARMEREIDKFKTEMIFLPIIIDI